MIGVTKLLCSTVEVGDPLRYGRWSARSPGHLLQFGRGKKPVVVWNMTKACNLRCIHCYITAKAQPDEGELTTEEGLRLIDDLAEFGVPVLLFSGEEPLMRDDLFVLSAHAVKRGIRAVISTNGTLIDERTAHKIKEAGFSYVGVKVSLRLTLNKHNFNDLPAILDLLEEENIRRACFYHLVYAGRGRGMKEDDLSLEETRAAVDLIFDRAKDFHKRRVDLEILTVDNHADGPYLLCRVQERQSQRVEEVLQLRRWTAATVRE